MKRGIELEIMPPDCPEWEYQNHADYPAFLRSALKTLLVDMRSGNVCLSEQAADTRPGHRRLFERGVPDDYDYFAGNYRGSNFKCLRQYQVGIQSDPRVGYPSDTVENEMRLLDQSIRSSIGQMRIALDSPSYVLTQERKLLLCVAAMCVYFEAILRIHPYANGNGHAARLLAWSFLGVFGYWPVKWPIDPRPGGDYIQAITEYRNGQPTRLIKRIMESLKP